MVADLGEKCRLNSESEAMFPMVCVIRFLKSQTAEHAALSSKPLPP